MEKMGFFCFFVFFFFFLSLDFISLHGEAIYFRRNENPTKCILQEQVATELLL